MDMGSSGNLRELGSQRSTSALQDEFDMLQEENESLLVKVMPVNFHSWCVTRL